jgi:hypothetical protein
MILGNESAPHISTQTRRLFLMTRFGVQLYWDQVTKTVTWPCDASGGETTHAATYGGSTWELSAYGPDVPYGAATGFYREVYVSKFTGWTIPS